MASDANVVDVLASTTNQPFCAGVILCHEDRILATLNTDGLPGSLRGKSLRMGGVGGGQEVGETIRECALREAREESMRMVATLLAKHPEPARF